MRAAYLVGAIASAALMLGCSLWNQPVTPVDKDSPLAIHCSATTWCDRRYYRCHEPTSDRPAGYCVFVGDDGRAFGVPRDGGIDP